MILKDVSFKDPKENILYDDVLLDLAEQGKTSEVLRFWESTTYFVVLGRIGRIQDDVDLKMAGKDHILILRRSSGGGTVLQGKGCFNYSLVLSKEDRREIRDLRQSYQFILSKVIDALGLLGIQAVFQPISDIALMENHKKVSGNAQKRARKFILHHGTLLYDFDLRKIERYLKMPQSTPVYRQGRPHTEFLANLCVPLKDIKDVFRKVFKTNASQQTLNAQEKECLDSFLKTKQTTVEFKGPNP